MYFSNFNVEPRLHFSFLITAMFLPPICFHLSFTFVGVLCIILPIFSHFGPCMLYNLMSLMLFYLMICSSSDMFHSPLWLLGSNRRWQMLWTLWTDRLGRHSAMTGHTPWSFLTCFSTMRLTNSSLLSVCSNANSHKELIIILISSSVKMPFLNCFVAFFFSFHFRFPI